MRRRGDREFRVTTRGQSMEDLESSVGALAFMAVRWEVVEGQDRVTALPCCCLTECGPQRGSKTGSRKAKTSAKFTRDELLSGTSGVAVVGEKWSGEVCVEGRATDLWTWCEGHTRWGQ